MVQLSRPLLGNLSVQLGLPAADAVGEQRRVGVVVGARGGGHPADVARAGGAAGAAGRAALGRRQVVLDDPGGWDGGGEVGGEGGVALWDWVPVDGDEALVGLRHGHGSPGSHRRHLARCGEGLGRVEVAGGSGGGVARVAEVADGAGAQRGGLCGGVASAARGRAGAGVGRHALPGAQAGVHVFESGPTGRPLLPALSHQTIKPDRERRSRVRNHNYIEERWVLHLDR